MLRLNNIGGDNYMLKDTETKEYLCRCMIIPRLSAIEIWSVKTFEKHQQKGYATIMLKRVIKKFRNEEKPLRLYVYKDNGTAIHLYEKLGFKIIGDYTFSAWTMEYCYK